MNKINNQQKKFNEQFVFIQYKTLTKLIKHAVETPVRKTPVSDHFSSEKFAEESAPLKSVENSQNYQI